MDGSSDPRKAHAWRGYVGLSMGWLAILAAVLLLTRRPAGQPIEILPPPTALPTAAPAPTATPGPCRVDVAGAVRTPGVYTLPRGSLVADAITAAGGPAGDADLDRLNKAIALQDGMQIYVPHLAQPSPVPVRPTLPTAAATTAPTRVTLGATTGSTPTGKLVNLNTATPEELDTLPGIGPSTAQKIIEGRPYGVVEDLMRVKGIGQATFDKLKDLVTVR
ncbi:MAG: ComEA family DNA-binding protein [Chloroflexi bacterium]|nr:ComEA family DNA-binding protein [Chloroflexota bacterium]